MAIAGLLVLALLIVGCVQATINLSSGTGTHELGPDKDSRWESSEDTQESTESINELSSRISGIDKSNQEIQKDIHKTSEIQQQQMKRDEQIDRLNPRIPKDVRRNLHKDKK